MLRFLSSALPSFIYLPFTASRFARCASLYTLENRFCSFARCGQRTLNKFFAITCCVQPQPPFHSPHPTPPFSVAGLFFVPTYLRVFVISLASALRNLLNALRGIRNYSCVRAPIWEFVCVCVLWCVCVCFGRCFKGAVRQSTVLCLSCFAFTSLRSSLCLSAFFPLRLNFLSASAPSPLLLPLPSSLASPVFYASGRVSLCIWHNDKNQQAPKCTESEGIQTKRNETQMKM